MTMIAVALPMLCFAALLKRDDFRESFLVSAIANGIFIAISTNVLSYFDLIDRVPLLACWSLNLAALLAWRYYRSGSGGKIAFEKFTADQKIVGILLAAVIAVAGIGAVVSAPNNFDSLTYHLPRVMHWIQNGNVEHYPTHIDRQLVMAPFSEFAIMHLQILSGSDRFANCVQWFSMVGSTVAVTLVVRVLKGGLNSQLIAAALSLSLPMGLLQSTSTQNDYVVAFWLVCLVYFIIKSKTNSGFANTALVGACLALAVFTKGTAYMVALPFILIYMWQLIAGRTGTDVFKIAVVVAALLLINGNHYARNLKVFGNPVSAGTGNDIICSRFDPAAVISNVEKNIATQLATGYKRANSTLSAATYHFHRAISIDVNEPDLTKDGMFIILPAHNHEDFAPNPLHMILMLIGAALLAIRRKHYPHETILFASATLLSFIVLSACIKWNPFISRYFLPVFIISAPFLSLLYDNNKFRPLVNACAAALLLFSFVVLANNEMRPLVGSKSIFVTDRIDQYFMVAPQAKPYFYALDNMIQGQPSPNLGILDKDGNMWEYLMWVLLKDNGVKYRIEHVEVSNPSASIPLKNFSDYYPVRF